MNYFSLVSRKNKPCSKSYRLEINLKKYSRNRIRSIHCWFWRLWFGRWWRRMNRRLGFTGGLLLHSEITSEKKHNAYHKIHVHQNPNSSKEHKHPRYIYHDIFRKLYRALLYTLKRIRKSLANDSSDFDQRFFFLLVAAFIVVIRINGENSFS